VSPSTVVPDGVGHGRLAGQEAVEGIGGHGDHRVAIRCFSRRTVSVLSEPR
jgi:hypothetical protein